MNNEKTIQITEEQNNIFNLLLDMINIRYLDLKHLSYWNNCIKKFECDFNYQDEIESVGFDKIDTNTYFYVVIDRLFYLICDEISNIISDEPDNDKYENLKQKLENLKNSFNPFINCLDSFFNNCFDELDLSKDKEEIIKDAIRLLELLE